MVHSNLEEAGKIVGRSEEAMGKICKRLTDFGAGRIQWSLWILATAKRQGGVGQRQGQEGTKGLVKRNKGNGRRNQQGKVMIEEMVNMIGQREFNKRGLEVMLGKGSSYEVERTVKFINRALAKRERMLKFRKG